MPSTLYEEALAEKNISNNMFYIYAHSGYCPFSSNLLKYLMRASKIYFFNLYSLIFILNQQR